MPSFTLTRRQALWVAAFALGAVFAAAHFLGGPKSQSAASQVGSASTTGLPALMAPGGSADPTPLDATSGAPATVVVIDVAGAVRRPGLYRLPQGSRIADAIARAGGLGRQADSALVNLAAPLADGEQVLVPARAGPGAATSAAGASSAAGPVDLNTATVEQLDALPGVGPVTAQKIVDYRTQHGPFTSVDDLDAIPGIGPSRIDNLRGLVIP